MENATEDAQSYVTCIYVAKIADLFRSITVTWSKNLVSHTLFIIVENTYEENHYTCKIDLKTWQFWGKKGLKTFKVDEKRLDIYWDVRSAKFTTSPEAVSDYYVALAMGGELVLMLGDQEKEALQRTKAKPSLVGAALVHKKESACAKTCFSTRTMLGQRKKEHIIIIESAMSGAEPEMWISVDGMECIRIVNLHWRFRGNETMMVDELPVEVFWDVHDWLYDAANAGPGIFIFKQSTNKDEASNSLTDCEEADEDYPSTDFCHIFYAWKTQ